MKIRILFLIRSLVNHGAERQLVELVKNLDKNWFVVTVVTFYDGGALSPEVQDLEGVSLLSLHKMSRWDLLCFLRLLPIALRTRPHIVHGYMGGANEICFLLGKLVRARVVWGLRASDIDTSRYDYARIAAVVGHIGRRMAPLVDLMIVNSVAGKRYFASIGYPTNRMRVIPNGIDTARYHPDRALGEPIRAEWGVLPHETLVGVVGRLDPVKDHPTFLRAAAYLAGRHEHMRFVCVGGGPESYARELRDLATELGLTDRLIWAGSRTDMLEVYNALDCAISSSVSEGFPNVIGEAMASGVPCVVTDVGDSAMIVGASDQVVASGDPVDLARACEAVIGLAPPEWEALSMRSRARIVEEFGVQRLVEATQSALRDI
ncbi:MAG: glycosyltransferase [Chloroflexota bacterium]